MVNTIFNKVDCYLCSFNIKKLEHYLYITIAVVSNANNSSSLALIIEKVTNDISMKPFAKLSHKKKK